MPFNVGEVHWGPDDQNKDRPHIVIGVLPQHQAVILAPITDYEKCPDKSFSFCEDDHVSFTKDCAVHFSKINVALESHLNGFNHRPPPVDNAVVDQIVQIAIGPHSQLMKLRIKAIKKAHGLEH